MCSFFMYFFIYFLLKIYEKYFRLLCAVLLRLGAVVHDRGVDMQVGTDRGGVADLRVPVCAVAAAERAGHGPARVARLNNI